MKRNQLIKHLKDHEAFLAREGRHHSIFQRGMLKTEVPRHREILDELARSDLQGFGYSFCEVIIKFKSVIKKSGGWWIGWLVDLPGVNAQERTQKELIDSLRIGAEDMLAMEVPFEPDAQMTTIMVKASAWAESQSV